MRKCVCENEKPNWMNERQRGKRHSRQGRARGEEQMARGASKRSKSRGRLLEDLSEKRPDRAQARANSSPLRRGTVDGQQCSGRATSGTQRLEHESAP